MTAQEWDYILVDLTNEKGYLLPLADQEKLLDDEGQYGGELVCIHNNVAYFKRKKHA